MAASARCCIVAVCFVLALASVQAADYCFIGRRGVSRNDILCGQQDDKGNPQPFCKLCGSDSHVPDARTVLADACDADPQCKGFDMEGDSCGYLKGASGRGNTAYTEEYSHYCKVEPGSDCEGAYIMKRSTDIVGHDIFCNGKNGYGKTIFKCYVSGLPVLVASSCSTNPDCKAFTITGISGGYLKSASGPITYTEGATTFIKA